MPVPDGLDLDHRRRAAPAGHHRALPRALLRSRCSSGHHVLPVHVGARWSRPAGHYLARSSRAAGSVLTTVSSAGEGGAALARCRRRRTPSTLRRRWRTSPPSCRRRRARPHPRPGNARRVRRRGPAPPSRRRLSSSLRTSRDAGAVRRGVPRLPFRRSTRRRLNKRAAPCTSRGRRARLTTCARGRAGFLRVADLRAVRTPRGVGRLWRVRIGGHLLAADAEKAHRALEGRATTGKVLLDP